jgi:hypothetical protein
MFAFGVVFSRLRKLLDWDVGCRQGCHHIRTRLRRKLRERRRGERNQRAAKCCLRKRLDGEYRKRLGRRRERFGISGRPCVVEWHQFVNWVGAGAGVRVVQWLGERSWQPWQR